MPAILGLVAAGEGWRILRASDAGSGQVLGPGAYLAGLGFALVAVAALLSMGRPAAPAASASADSGRWTVPLLVAACAAFTALLPRVGFAPAITLFFAAILLGVCRFRPSRAIPGALAAGAAFHILFVTLFDVPFPAASLLAGR